MKIWVLLNEHVGLSFLGEADAFVFFTQVKKGVTCFHIALLCRIYLKKELIWNVFRVIIKTFTEIVIKILQFMIEIRKSSRIKLELTGHIVSS